jgi:hypothetical protein
LRKFTENCRSDGAYLTLAKIPKMSRRTKIIGAVVLLLLLLQLVPSNREAPPVDPAADFFAVNRVDPPLAATIRSACYDCHSHTTAYPWYARIAPVSFWIQHHVEEGREHLNFATWADYDLKKQAHKLEECWEEVEEGEMPLRSYTWLHAPARLSDAQRAELVRFFQQLQFSTSVGVAE